MRELTWIDDAGRRLAQLVSERDDGLTIETTPIHVGDGPARPTRMVNRTLYWRRSDGAGLKQRVTLTAAGVATDGPPVVYAEASALPPMVRPRRRCRGGVCRVDDGSGEA